MRQLIRTYEITGQHEITISDYSFTKEDVRLIINESLASTDKLASVLVSSTAKDNIVSVEEGIITLADTTAELNTDDTLTIEIDIDNVAKEDTATANKRKIMGADSQMTWDCEPSVPVLTFNFGSLNSIVESDGKYLFVNEPDIVPPYQEQPVVGSVVRASQLDEENGYLLCTAFTDPHSVGNVNKIGDDYYLNTAGGATFVPVEANKNYRCKEIVNLEYVPNPLQPSSTITGKLYIWEEYEGESIKDGVEEIKDFVEEKAAGINANISDIQALIGYTISEIDGI